MLNVDQKVRDLRRKTVGELREEYAEVFGEPTRSHHKDFLVRRIAWRLQANALGGLSERARQRAAEIANESDLRTRAPSPLVTINSGRTVTRTVQPPSDQRLPMPGALLTRVYKGRAVHVKVLERGFEYDGEVYRSLSAIAKEVTGAHWNGFQFFNVQNSKGKERP